MGRGASDETKVNRIYQARMKGAERDPGFKTKEYAAYKLGTTTNILSKLETGNVKCPKCDIIARMVEEYGDPFLAYWFMSHPEYCPLGQHVTQHIEESNIYKPISCLLSSIEQYGEALRTLGNVFADDRLDDEEEPDLDAADNQLATIQKFIAELRATIQQRKDEKHLQKARAEHDRFFGVRKDAGTREEADDV